MAELRQEVKNGFERQSERARDIEDYWNCYNCELDHNQCYDGNSTIYVPIVKNAVDARATRFVNQAFPQSGRYVEAHSADGSSRSALAALLDHYIRSARFKTQVAKPLSRNGDIEGQYNLYVDWMEINRRIVSRETHAPIDPETGTEVPGIEIEDVSEEDVHEGAPTYEVLHDSDVLVLPASADSVEEALEAGGSVTIVRRWSKAKIAAMAAAGHIRKDESLRLKETMGKAGDGDRDIEKRLAEHTGVREKGTSAVVWETWTKLPLGGSELLCRVFFGPDDATLGVKRNPHWNDRCPLLSVPVHKLAGVFKGDSPVAAVASLQYEANDAVNEGADAAAYSALPIVARDPEKSQGPMVLNLAAIWDIDPNSVRFLAFPDLTQRAIARVQYAAQEIFQTLGINPAMLPQQTGRPGTKRNQAEIALEQSIDLLMTAEAVSVLEEGILSPAMAWTVDLDYQFRDKPILVRAFGELGRQAAMEEVGPLANRNGLAFTWRGGETVRQNAMMQQQGTVWLNVLRGLRQDLAAEGMSLHLGPIVEAGTANVFGPLLGARVVREMAADLAISSEEENEMMLDGFEVPVHPLDRDPQHISSHREEMQRSGDPHGTIRMHLALHLRQSQMKAQAMQMAQLRRQMSGGAGGAGGPPGRPGLPQQAPGVRPAGPRLVRAPAGRVHPDQMPRAGAVPMPRRM